MSEDMTQEELDKALMNAAKNGDAGGVGWLVDRGAMIEAADMWNNRPLHFAACRGHRDVVELLLDRGAKVDVATEYGMQPLHLAARFGRKDVVELLLEHGAMPLALDGDAQTPRALCKNVEIRALLEVAEREWKDPALREREALAAHLARQRKLGALRPKGPAL